mmetsp:Transcript_77146/g.208292  ORF Transcript_77146/g.208292 Transcript_77146/m.208292 type:complete len:120 (+) Transcript_77146:180-539(+)
MIASRIEVEGETARLHIWDTSGDEKYRRMISAYVRGVHGVLLVFDLNNEESFASVKQWKHLIDQHARDKVSRQSQISASCFQLCFQIPVVLVGNKSDLVDKQAPHSCTPPKFIRPHLLP